MKNSTWKGVRLLSVAGALSLAALGACSEEAPRAVDDDDGSGSSSASSGGQTASTTGAGGATSSTGGGTSVPDGPSVMSFAATEAVVYENDQVTFTAQVEDPDGIGDVTGGELKDSNGVVYGTFLKSGGGNGYAVSVNWDEIDELSAIEFVTGSSEDRVFVAEFTDVAGNIGSSQFTLNMQCSSGDGYCGGYCTDTNTDSNNCGGCGTQCLCATGSCEACEVAPVTPGYDCDTVCAAKGQTCNESACDDGGIGYSDAACTVPISNNYYCDYTFSTSVTHVQCCCS